ncbi:uncharacterized protein CDV56_101123 [Aspergillus thermomutatus]|uniref:Histidine-specific methyltransferase SAM-dependent domain-containing protein n=1 Tax=Aspergillus thermomutatus TaxID=41047 RepID=A0A397G2E7_ASPTH|nr:uncharacterized protein CDV56_101123 [Aspergillus thermomutatus]RHZ44054.1 hypothetical protein CDV56_101123 [Aspergillus thermomutatus]
MTVTTLPAFNDLVAHALISHSTIQPEQLIVLDNSSKYQPHGFKQNTNQEQNLAAIFNTMATLNRLALEDPRTCAGKLGPSFRDALLQAADEIAMLADNRPIRYVELGPEPWKSRAILERLLARGVSLCQYVGIDINPESERTMREALAPVTGEERFSYWVEDFYKCSVAGFPKPKGETTPSESLVTVVTNLGFQEGNDLPARIGPMLKSITRSGDILLSEMQVFGGGADPSLIEQFYQHPEMNRFSGLVGECFESDGAAAASGSAAAVASKHVFHLLPLQTEIGSVNVATTLAPVRVNGHRKYVLTNSCLKYTREQFQQAREYSGDFVVKLWQETGDKSVVFQVSERR